MERKEEKSIPRQGFISTPSGGLSVFAGSGTITDGMVRSRRFAAAKTFPNRGWHPGWGKIGTI